MGNAQSPDPQPDGSNSLILHNSLNFSGRHLIQAGSTPKVQWRTAGFGAQIVAADGVTVILDVPETGFVVSGSYVQLTPQASAPVGITEGGIWYSSADHQYHGLDNTGDVLL